MTVLPRIATAGELAKLRSDNQSSQVYLTIPNPPTIYTARLAAVPSSTDSVASITYNNGSGTHTDILPDMTMLVGTSAGARDKGEVRIRNLTGIGATSGTFNIGEESAIDWPSGAYLTVIDDFLLWPKHPRLVNNVYFMDYDIVYSAQNSHCDSIPIMGAAYVAWLRGGTVNITPDGSQSWALNNSIDTYLWTAPGASATANLNTATPTITYNATGRYRISLTVHNDDGAEFTGYRYVYVLDPTPNQEANGAITTFQIEEFSGAYQNGGWTVRTAMQENAATTLIRDRAMIILHSRDWYGNVEGSIGYVAGCENIRFVGWIDGESIQWSPEGRPSTVIFNASTANVWLDKMTAFPAGLKNRTSVNAWFKFNGLTAKAATWQILHWRTTATRMMDVFACDNSLAAMRLEAPGAQTIWQQINTILESTVLAKACCDRYSRLFMQVEQNLTDTTSRAAIPEVMTIAKTDWMNDINFDRREVDQAAYVDLSGVRVFGGVATPLFSLSPGHVFDHYGASEVADRLVLEDQAQANALAGLYHGWRNNPYPNFRLSLAQHNPMFDIAPHQWLIITPDSDDTPRGIADPIRIIPRSIGYSYQNGFFTMDVEVEAETFEQLAITGDTPADPPDPPYVPPVLPPDIPPIVPPGLPADATELWLMLHKGTGTGYNILWSSDFTFSTDLNDASYSLMDSWPAGFDSTSDSGGIFRMTADGANLYIFRNNTIWQCTNVAAIRAAPATTPTWTQIAAVGDSVLGLTLERVGAIEVYGTRLLATGQIGPTSRSLCYGEYDGSAWTWSNFVLGSIGTGPASYCTYQRINTRGPANLSLQNVYSNGGSLLNSFTWAAGVAASVRMWRNYNAGTVYVGSRPTPETTIRIHNAITGALLYDTGYTDTELAALRGAFYGAQIYVITRDGQFHYSIDGSSFVSHSTWAATAGLGGEVQDAAKNGGGPLVWCAGNTTSNEVVRNAKDGATGTFANKTGNIWSLISGDVTFNGMQLVFI